MRNEAENKPLRPFGEATKLDKNRGRGEGIERTGEDGKVGGRRKRLDLL